ncbi:NAD(P)/FAD-dependent oxidoreductase [Methanothrix harundinacea]|uniref:Thioredoxin reductase n=1 Tax=Methanothrix harundinacea (strain 6Ac) TaxID=1110509 RepID=G7WL62_METH6|nr:FAD-dependent oxidoreductase [Methanothrix harundinacea]AET63616.1 Thioredoxin reductase [Methanothrix harundinacea 6Ac]
MYDVIIIGAGPAGLTAGMYCARGGKKILILGNVYGSQQSMGGLYENYPGFPEGIQGIELSERMVAQAKKYGAELHEEVVAKVVSLNGVFRVKTESWEYQARALILAMGARHRTLSIPGEVEYATRGVSYCAYCDGALFRNKTVAVIGYGNGAARAVLYLAGLCARVHLLNVREDLVAEAIYLDRIKSLTNFVATPGVEPISILGDGFVTGVEFRARGKVRTLKVDGVFVEMGVSPNVELAADLGVELTKGGFVKVNRLTQETNIPGVFAAGDVTGGRMQVTTAVGAGTSAAISAMRHIQ